MLLFLRNSVRLIYIGYIVIVIKLKKKQNSGEYLFNALYRLGPIFIKIGQMLSVRPDLIGEELASCLEKLQDRLPPFPTDVAKKIISHELGAAIEQLFSKFEETPVSAASIAQVHKAVTTDQRLVAVKVLRPGIENCFKNDLSLIRFIIKLLERFRSSSKKAQLINLLEYISESIKIEIDLALEGAAASELREKTQNDHNIYIPQVDWARTSQKVLTCEWVDGTSIYQTEELKAQGFNLYNLAKDVAVMFFNQSFRDGFFHADLHPGNIFVTKQGKIALVDFGIMGRLDYQSRLYIAEILYGFLTRDYELVAKVHFAAGYVSASKSPSLFAQYCRAIGEPIVGLPVNQISVGKLLGKLFKLNKDFAMPIQHHLLLLQKSLLLVEGIGLILDPGINMWQVTEPWMKDWAEKNLEIEARTIHKIKKFGRFLFKDLPEFVHDKVK